MGEEREGEERTGEERRVLVKCFSSRSVFVKCTCGGKGEEERTGEERKERRRQGRSGVYELSVLVKCACAVGERRKGQDRGGA
eukprot:7408409-Pyramimonas_sp.AAC.1